MLSFREKIKRTPFFGPLLHQAYLACFYNEGEVLTISSGPLKDLKWIRFMRIHNDQYIDGTYEPAVQRVLEERLRPGMTFYDVGANAGFFSLLGARLVGPTGRVVSFEPHPLTASILAKQMAFNGKSNVRICVKAVTEMCGTARLDDEKPAVMASIMNTSSQRTIVVPVTTLDWEVSRHPPPDLIKIDVEGAEMRVLRGAEALLTTRRPDLLVELHSKELSDEYHIHMDALNYVTVPVDDRFVLSIAH